MVVLVEHPSTALRKVSSIDFEIVRRRTTETRPQSAASPLVSALQHVAAAVFSHDLC